MMLQGGGRGGGGCIHPHGLLDSISPSFGAAHAAGAWGRTALPRALIECPELLHRNPPWA